MMALLPFRLPAAALLALTLAGGSVVGIAAASPQHKPRHATAPPPPASRDVEPETTATIPARAPTRMPDLPAVVAKPDDETLPAPFHLPTASRTRMRDCGLKWQAMKMAGETGEDIWRDFATRCLAAATGPLDKR